MPLTVIILAAGSGTRMRSGVPKVLHPLAGTPMLERVVNTAAKLDPRKIIVVAGDGGDIVRREMQYLNVAWAEQAQALGTGHAVLQALPQVADDDQVLILYGDVPLISLTTLENLIDNTRKNAVGIVVAEFENPQGFGRIIRNEMGNIIAIVEEKDANDEQKLIHEINTGILTTSAEHLKDWLPKLKNENTQGEYYLTDIIATAEANGFSVGGVLAHSPEEVYGVNNLLELAKQERFFQRRLSQELLLNGTALLDPERFDVRGELNIGRDCMIDINVVCEGKVTLGNNVKIGPNTVLRNVTIADNVNIEANCVIEDANIGEYCQIGPFARIRPGTALLQHAKVGNFVEIKKATLGVGSKANHLTYIGDATVGNDVIIGAGTITCNYDGANKHQTVIEDGVLIGSNTQLIAPVIVGKGATIGAGSTIADDAPAECLTVARAKQRSIKNWQRPQKGKEK